MSQMISTSIPKHSGPHRIESLPDRLVQFEALQDGLGDERCHQDSEDVGCYVGGLHGSVGNEGLVVFVERSVDECRDEEGYSCSGEGPAFSEAGCSCGARGHEEEVGGVLELVHLREGEAGEGGQVGLGGEVELEGQKERDW